MSLSEADRQFQYELLQGVARTFALSIPELPQPLADVIANAYLLCRIADTIEDEPAIPIATKCQLAAQFVELLATKADATKFTQQFLSLLSEQRLAAEKRLINESAHVIAITHSFTAIQQATLLRCVRIMSQGMVYYQFHACPGGIKTIRAFDNYCYHVAGVVGEMLTELCCEYSPELASRRDELLSLSVSFGQALQMTNILRDIWEDYARGVCWLPRELFSRAGFNLDQLPDHAATVSYSIGLCQMIALCNKHMDNAITYTLQIPKDQSGLRRFCFSAIGMAILTLNKIYRRQDFNSATQIKISKASVLMIMVFGQLACGSNTLIRVLLKFWRRKLPVELRADTDTTHHHIEEWFNQQLTG